MTSGGIAGELLLRIAVVFLAYLIAGKLGQATTSIRSSNLGPVWPAYGIALAAFLAYGYRVWPGIVASAFLVAFSSSVPALAAAGQAIGATAAALTGASLLRRIPEFDPSLSRLSHALGLVILGAFGSSIISASIGVFSLYVTQVQAYSGFGLGLADLLARRRHRRAAGHAARVHAADSVSHPVAGAHHGIRGTPRAPHLDLLHRLWRSAADPDSPARSGLCRPSVRHVGGDRLRHRRRQSFGLPGRHHGHASPPPTASGRSPATVHSSTRCSWTCSSRCSRSRVWLWGR